MQAALVPSSNTVHCSLQALERRNDQLRWKAAMAAYALKTQTLVFAAFSIFAEVPLQCMLHSVYRSTPAPFGGTLRHRHNGKMPPSACHPLPIPISGGCG